MKILEAKNITKMFPGVIALDSVDVAFEPGEIHAIIGENGAGKSTLIKCLTGVYQQFWNYYYDFMNRKKEKS